ncbi:MAG TPA: P1 family peptidase [Steroidobacteraceae bacterium]|nr:P1 family peptidase [Steroidobacteraceae bacterium]
MPAPGARNLITDVGGLGVGHALDEEARSGVTVVLCGDGWAAGVDVRGGGPGTRETEALSPENLVGRAHALVLAGGSVFGLAAADGVAAALSDRGVGLEMRQGSRSPKVPIVPCAVLYDLGNGGNKSWGRTPPYRELGVAALEAAGPDFALGRVGAGRGAALGLLDGGIGTASLDLGGGIMVGALVAANAVGSALMPDGETYWAWPFELAGEFGGRGPPRRSMDTSNPVPDDSRLNDAGRAQVGVNTTIAVVACSADLGGAECKRVAMMAHDGIARAVRPAHTPFDGDTIFAVASAARPLVGGMHRAAEVARIGAAAADCTARAIARAAYASNPRLQRLR